MKTTEKLILKKNIRQEIMENFANQILQSVKDYNVELGLEIALKLIQYENVLNHVIKADKIEIKEGRELLREIDAEEQEILVHNAKKEIKSLILIKSHTSRG